MRGRKREDGRGKVGKEDDGSNRYYKRRGATRARLALCKKEERETVKAVGTRKKKSRKRTGENTSVESREICIINGPPEISARNERIANGGCGTKE